MPFFNSNPVKKLEKAYAKKTAAANAAQRAGKIPEFATLTAEAEEIGKQIDAAKQQQAKS